ncbi:MAG: peptide deformylase [Herpetosiphonaceae bacterium]|nr:MAG: peptide deformylase [Herpetosiphonaceae bacterium]
MAVQRICELGDPILRQATLPLDDLTGPRTRALVADLFDTLRDFRSRTGYGRSMAAPQIGVLLRAMVIESDEGAFELLNPRYERWSRTETEIYESCLSFPTIWGLVSRPTSITVIGYNLNGEQQRIEATGNLARIIQHAMDHLDGLVWLDRSPDIQSICTTGEYERRYKRNNR